MGQADTLPKPLSAPQNRGLPSGRFFKSATKITAFAFDSGQRAKPECQAHKQGSKPTRTLSTWRYSRFRWYLSPKLPPPPVSVCCLRWRLRCVGLGQAPPASPGAKTVPHPSQGLSFSSVRSVQPECNEGGFRSRFGCTDIVPQLVNAICHPGIQFERCGHSVLRI